jgi:type I restriction enzyme S subunit
MMVNNVGLPWGWVSAKWKDVVDITHGQEKKGVVCPDGIYPIYGSGGEIGRSSRFLCKAGSIVVGRKGTINRPFFTKTNFWNIDTAFGVTAKVGLMPEFLFLFCQYFNFTTLDHSTGRPSLTQTNLYGIEMPLPPLAEQKRIVEKIDALFSELDKGMEVLQTIRQQLRTYRQAVLKWAFKGEEWEYKPLLSHVETIFDGPFGSNLKTADYTDSGVRVVRLENIKSLYFFDEKKSFVSPEKYEALKRNTVSFPDLMMSTFIAGEMRLCIMPQHIEKAINKADCVCIRTGSSIQSKFLMYYLSTKQVYDSFFNQIHGATRPRVNTTQIKEIPVPVISEREQTEIVNSIESRLSVCDKLEQLVEENISKSQALRQSILKKAFAGQLVPQDPNDEPAEKLLERIKGKRKEATKDTKYTKGNKIPGVL